MELWSAEQAMPGLMVCIFSFLPGIPVSFGCFLSEPIRKHWHSQHLVQSCRPAIQSIKNIFWGRAAAYSFRGNFQEWKAVLNLLDHKGWLLLSPCLQTSLGDLRPSCSPSRCNCPDFHFSRRSFTWINNCHLARNFLIPERTAFFKSRLPWYLPENSNK